ncbi:rhomboid family intramembrane serine protease [Nocardia alni]|uniref:rhomboid family intramembrane serine protease n=1 Tax=Nocardia alni TaxID=2815723 RepID=UPI001C232F29|nr:rhomboid family intramembrane serine protease [Nocardia alni]
MNPQPPAPTCFRHPDRVTGLACTRCGRPACPECLRPAAVGQQCVECVAQGQRATPQVRTPVGAPVTTRPTPYVTYALIALNVAAYAFTAVQAHSVAHNSDSTLFYDWVLAPQEVAQGQWIRVVGGAFLHFGPIHLAVNMFALFILGRDAETVLGRTRYLAIYLTSLLGGAAAVMWLARDSATAGASGAIFGLFGALAVVLLRLRRSPTQLLVVIVINLIISVSVPGISLWGHLGGLAAGTLATVGLLYVPRWLRVRSQAAGLRIGWAALAAVAVLAVVLIAGAAAAIGS